MEEIKEGTHNHYMPKWVADKLIEHRQDLFKSSHKKDNEKLLKEYTKILKPHLDAKTNSQLETAMQTQAIDEQRAHDKASQHSHSSASKQSDHISSSETHSLENIIKKTYKDFVSMPEEETWKVLDILFKQIKTLDETLWKQQTQEQRDHYRRLQSAEIELKLAMQTQGAEKEKVLKKASSASSVLENTPQTKLGMPSSKEIFKKSYSDLAQLPIPKLQEIWCLLKNEHFTDELDAREAKSQMKLISWVIEGLKGDSNDMPGKCSPSSPHDEL